MKRLFFIFVCFTVYKSSFSQNVLLEKPNSNIIYPFYDNVFNLGIDTCDIGELFIKPSSGEIQQINNEIHWYIKSFNYSGSDTLTIGYIDNNLDSIILAKKGFIIRFLPDVKIILDKRVYPGHFRGDLNSRLKYLKDIKAVIPTLVDTLEVVHFEMLIKYKDEELPMFYNNWGSELSKGIREILTGSRNIDAILLTNFFIEKNGKYTEFFIDENFFFTGSETKKKTYDLFMKVLDEDRLPHEAFYAREFYEDGSTNMIFFGDTVDLELKLQKRNDNSDVIDTIFIASSETSKLYEITCFDKYRLVKTYYQNGKLKQEGAMSNNCGRKNLGLPTFDPDTFEAMILPIKTINKTGEWKTYNEKGELIYKRMYDCGNLITEEKIPTK